MTIEHIFSGGRGLRIGARTRQGSARASNEDAYLVLGGDALPSWCAAVAAVFDGASGLPGGGVASARAAERLQSLLGGPAFARSDVRDAGHVLKGLLTEVHGVLIADGRRGSRRQEMATTATVAVITHSPPAVWLATVGDSPAYRVRDGRITKLSEDDSFVGQLVRRGMIPPNRAEGHPWGHVMTQALGLPGEIDPHVGQHPLKPGDRLLLCTDGLTDAVSEEDILAALTAAEGPAEACESLIRAAEKAGGTDDVTVVVMSAG